MLFVNLVVLFQPHGGGDQNTSLSSSRIAKEWMLDKPGLIEIAIFKCLQVPVYDPT